MSAELDLDSLTLSPYTWGMPPIAQSARSGAWPIQPKTPAACSKASKMSQKDFTLETWKCSRNCCNILLSSWNSYRRKMPAFWLLSQHFRWASPWCPSQFWTILRIEIFLNPRGGSQASLAEKTASPQAQSSCITKRLANTQAASRRRASGSQTKSVMRM